MISRNDGVTLIEIIVVLVIIAIATVFAIPNFLTPGEQAKAANAQNNLLAIYSAQQNYKNNSNTNSYCTAACSTLAQINSVLSLQIQDDGTYAYSCAGVTCTAARNSNANLVITVTLNNPIKIAGEVNPACGSTTGNGNWCP